MPPVDSLLVRGWENIDMVWVNLDGAANVRDLGGLRTRDGGLTVPGRLLRGDNLQELTTADVTRLVAELGIRTVVDLRSKAELRSEGPAPLDSVPSVRHAHHPVLTEVGTATDAMADALLVRPEQDRSRYPDDPTCGHYLGYLEERPDQVVGALRDIARTDGAAIVHCAAGKDRTGVVVALALTAAGVPAGPVVADYAASGERIAAVIERLRRSPTYADDINAKPADSHTPRAATMAAFLDQVDIRYGGVSKWLAGNGFTDDDLTQLRSHLRDR